MRSSERFLYAPIMNSTTSYCCFVTFLFFLYVWECHLILLVYFYPKNIFSPHLQLWNHRIDAQGQPISKSDHNIFV